MANCNINSEFWDDFGKLYWVNYVEYFAGDKVVDDGISYKSKTTNTNSKPVDNISDWEVDENLSNGGTVDGNLDITGDLEVDGSIKGLDLEAVGVSPNIRLYDTRATAGDEGNFIANTSGDVSYIPGAVGNGASFSFLKNGNIEVLNDLEVGGGLTVDETITATSNNAARLELIEPDEDFSIWSLTSGGGYQIQERTATGAYVAQVMAYERLSDGGEVKFYRDVNLLVGGLQLPNSDKIRKIAWGTASGVGAITDLHGMTVKPTQVWGILSSGAGEFVTASTATSSHVNFNVWKGASGENVPSTTSRTVFWLAIY